MNETILIASPTLKHEKRATAAVSFKGVSRSYYGTKRLLDLALVIGAAPIYLPLMLVLSGFVRISSGDPVFYGHTRIGLAGKRFRAWKFRTMVPDADAMLAKHLAENPNLKAEWERDQKLKNDPRVTSVGKFLRATSLDELPQLWNVLMGEMSLVGPRPIVDKEVQKYNDAFDLYIQVLPGLTGAWQVSGRNNTTYAKRVALDEHYIRNWSLLTDLFILVKTIRTVLFRDGAY